jgi:hypothetical protein
MPDYMLLLYERPETFANVTSEQMEQVVAKYVAWRTRLGSTGKISGGNKLRDGSGRSLQPGGGRVTVRDGPFTETKDVIGGYFIINAASYDEAVDLARDCPHLLFGGGIEIREIEPT